MVSFYALPDDNSIENVIGEDPDNITSILAEGISAAFMNGQWIGTLTTIEREEGYWIGIDGDAVLDIVGSSTDPATLYSLHDGSNLVSYPFSGHS